ncbi:MAG: hypothetical protein WDO13_10045 [Verrucomicrobiota bacterium]
MKMNKLTLAALVAAGLALASSAASAQTITAANEDLFLGFQQQGNPTDLLVDLGQSSNFTAGTASEQLPQVVVQDLISTFGADWATTVQWSVAGDSGPNPVGSGVVATSLDSGTSIPKEVNQQTLTPIFNTIGQLVTGFNNFGTAVSDNNSAVTIGSSASPANTLADSYTTLVGTPGKGYTLVNDIEQTGAGSDILYSFLPATSTTINGQRVFPPATEVGTFTLSDDGLFTFVGASFDTPEPSAYALGVCAVLLFLVLKRRHSVA